ncbi:MAG: hypothetical protein ACREJ3_19275 [Polyangiaceae bacterium]
MGSSHGRMPWLFLGVSLAAHGAIAIAIHAAPPASLLPAAARAPHGASDARPLAGDTFDIDPTVSAPSMPSMPSISSMPARLAATAPARSPARTSALAHENRSAHEAATISNTLFGAVGVAYASDLATAFTRAFPQAASPDPLWRSGMALGSSSSADVTLTLDDDGRMIQSLIEGAPSRALHQGIERSLALLEARVFTARAPVTRLQVTARVTPDDVHDGLHGDVFALSGGSFAGRVGTAFFALPPAGGSGRRIDIDVRLLP